MCAQELHAGVATYIVTNELRICMGIVEDPFLYASTVNLLIYDF
jgi:hypothetical protein